MDDSSAVLRTALVEAYVPYVAAKLGEFGLDADPCIDDLRAAQAALSASIEGLLDKPYPEQRRGPLELFQEAMATPTAILEDAGIEPPPRDAVSEAALPGDLYDLAPASSRSLGEGVWHAHLTWGATKAAAMRAHQAE